MSGNVDWNHWLKTNFIENIPTEDGLYIVFKTKSGDSNPEQIQEQDQSYVLRQFVLDNDNNILKPTKIIQNKYVKNGHVVYDDIKNINELGFLIKSGKIIPITQGKLEIETGDFKKKFTADSALYNFYMYGIYDWVIKDAILNYSSTSNVNSNNDHDHDEYPEDFEENDVLQAKKKLETPNEVNTSTNASNVESDQLAIAQKKISNKLSPEQIQAMLYKDFDAYKSYIEGLNEDPYVVYGGGDPGKTDENNQPSHYDISTMNDTDKMKLFKQFGTFLIKLLSIPLNAQNNKGETYWADDRLKIIKPLLFFKFKGMEEDKLIIMRRYYLRKDSYPYNKIETETNTYYSDVPFVIKSYLIHEDSTKKDSANTAERTPMSKKMRNMINSWLNTFYLQGAIEALNEYINHDETGLQSLYISKTQYDIQRFWKKYNLLKSVILINKFDSQGTKRINPHYEINTDINGDGYFSNIQIQYDYSLKTLNTLNFKENSFIKRYGQFSCGIAPDSEKVNNNDKWDNAFFGKLKDNEILNVEKDTFIFGYGSSGSGKTSSLIYDNRKIFDENNTLGSGLITKYIERIKYNYDIKIHEMWQYRNGENQLKNYMCDNFIINKYSKLEKKDEIVLNIKDIKYYGVPNDVNKPKELINNFFNQSNVINLIIEMNHGKNVEEDLNIERYLLYYYNYTDLESINLIKKNVPGCTQFQKDPTETLYKFPNQNKKIKYFGTFSELRNEKNFEYETSRYSANTEVYDKPTFVKNKDNRYGANCKFIDTIKNGDNGYNKYCKGKIDKTKALAFGIFITNESMKDTHMNFSITEELKKLRDSWKKKIEFDKDYHGKVKPWWFIDLKKKKNNNTFHIFTKIDLLNQKIKNLEWNKYKLYDKFVNNSKEFYIRINNINYSIIPLTLQETYENILYIESLMSININNYFIKKLDSIRNNNIINFFEKEILNTIKFKIEDSLSSRSNLNEYNIFEYLSTIMDNMAYYNIKWKHKSRRNYYVFNRMKIFKKWCAEKAEELFINTTNNDNKYQEADNDIFAKSNDTYNKTSGEIDNNFRDICIHKYTLMYYLNNKCIEDKNLSMNYLDRLKKIFDDKHNLSRDFDDCIYYTSPSPDAKSFNIEGPLALQKDHIQNLATSTEIYNATKINIEEYIDKYFSQTEIKNIKMDPTISSKYTNDKYKNMKNPNSRKNIDSNIPNNTEKFYNKTVFDLSSINFFGNYLDNNHSEIVKFYLYLIDFLLLHYSFEHYNFIFDEETNEEGIHYAKRFKNYTADNRLSTVLWHSVDVDRNINSTMNNPDSSRSHVLYEITTTNADKSPVKKFIGDFAGIENKFDNSSMITIKEFIRKDYDKKTIPNEEYNVNTSDITYDKIVIKSLLENVNFQKYMYNKNNYLLNEDAFLSIINQNILNVDINCFNSNGKICTIVKPNKLKLTYIQTSKNRKESAAMTTEPHSGKPFFNTRNGITAPYFDIINNGYDFRQNNIESINATIDEKNSVNRNAKYEISQGSGNYDFDCILLPYKFKIKIYEEKKEEVYTTLIVDLMDYYKRQIGTKSVNWTIEKVNINKYHKLIRDYMIKGDIFGLIDNNEFISKKIVYFQEETVKTNEGPLAEYKKSLDSITKQLININIIEKTDIKQYVTDTINLFINTYFYIEDRLVEGKFINASLIDMVEDVKWVAYFQKQGGKFGTFDLYDNGCEKVDICYSLKHRSKNDHNIKSDIMKLLLYTGTKTFNINNTRPINDYKLDILDHLNDKKKRYINLNMVAFGVLNVTYDGIKDNPPSDPYLDISFFQQKLELYNDNKAVICGESNSKKTSEETSKETSEETSKKTSEEKNDCNSTNNSNNHFEKVEAEFTKLKVTMSTLIKQKDTMKGSDSNSEETTLPIVYYSDAWETYNKYINMKNPTIIDFQNFEKEITAINMRTPMGTMDVLYNFIHHNSVGYSYTFNDTIDVNSKQINFSNQID